MSRLQIKQRNTNSRLEAFSRPTREILAWELSAEASWLTGLCETTNGAPRTWATRDATCQLPLPVCPGTPRSGGQRRYRPCSHASSNTGHLSQRADSHMGGRQKTAFAGCVTRRSCWQNSCVAPSQRHRDTPFVVSHNPVNQDASALNSQAKISLVGLERPLTCCVYSVA